MIKKFDLIIFIYKFHSYKNKNELHRIFRLHISGQELVECSPQEKLDFFTIYLIRYSSFIREQVVKLKQIEHVESDRLPVEESYLDDSIDISAILDTSCDGSPPSGGRYADYFVYYESKSRKTRKNMKLVATPTKKDEQADAWVIVEKEAAKEITFKDKLKEIKITNDEAAAVAKAEAELENLSETLVDVTSLDDMNESTVKIDEILSDFSLKKNQLESCQKAKVRF